MIIKIVRAAAPALDRALAALHKGGYHRAANETQIAFREMSVVVTPAKTEHRKPVFSVAMDEFRREGWGFSTQFDTEAEHDPDSLSDRKSMTFLHPRSLTQMGTKKTSRPSTFRIDVPTPDPSLQITAEMVQQFVNEVGEVVLDTFRDQAMAEDGPNADRKLWASESE